MKRILTIMTIVAMTAVASLAVPAKHISRKALQPDGSFVTLTLSGDEWMHGYVTEDGLTATFDINGHAVYATSQGPTDVYVHEVSERGADEISFIETNIDDLTFSRRRTKATAFLNHSALDERDADDVPCTGTVRIPVILAGYPDVPFINGAGATADFQDFLNSGKKNVNKYFNDMSLGKFNPEFHIFGPYSLARERSHYGGKNQTGGGDERSGEMVAEAVDLADGDVDFSMFDNNGDGICDVVIVIYAGVGQSSSNVAEAVWPCQWTLDESGTGSLNRDGVRVNRYAVINEAYGDNPSRIDGIGTFCHEFSHCLGLPDFYETISSNGYFGMNAWSLMDYGSYNDDGFTPVGYSAYEKAFMGWTKLTPAAPDTYYTLPVLNEPGNPQTLALTLTNPQDSNEYFILENRRKTGWDSYIQDEGMMITHVTYQKGAWAANTVNSYELQRMTIVPADNHLTKNTLHSDLWPKEYAVEFTNVSTPAAITNSGSFLSQPLTEITRDEETGEVSLWVSRRHDNGMAPIMLKPVAEGESGFTARWQPFSFGECNATYTLQVWPAGNDIPAPEAILDFNKGIKGWTAEGKTHQQSSSLTLGSKEDFGSIRCDSIIKPEDRTVTVVINAKRYGTDSGSVMEVRLTDNDGKQAGVEVFDMPREAAYHTHAFTGLDSRKRYTVTISSRKGGGRVMIYSAMILTGDYSDLDDTKYDAVCQAMLEDPSSIQRTEFSGIDRTSHTISGLQPRPYSCRVKAVPTDSSFEESFWSETAMIDLSRNSISDISDGNDRYFSVSKNIVSTPVDARIFDISGKEIAPVSPGLFRIPKGIYIITSPGHEPEKISI